MNNSVVLISGAPTGIGCATTLAFAKGGATLVVFDRNDEAGNTLATEPRDIGAGAAFVRADIGHGDEVESLVDRMVARFGRLNVAVNDAGTDGQPGPATEQTVEGFTAMFENGGSRF